MFERNRRSGVPTAKTLQALDRLLKTAEESKEDHEILSVFCDLADELLSDVYKRIGSRTGKNIPVEKNQRAELANAYYQYAELLTRLGGLKNLKKAKKSRGKAEA